MSERDLLFELWQEHGACVECDYNDGWELADAIIAAGFCRPEPVTPETETEWEYRIDDGKLIRYTQSPSRVKRALMKGLRVRGRSKEIHVPAGPWLLVEATPETAELFPGTRAALNGLTIRGGEVDRRSDFDFDIATGRPLGSVEDGGENDG